MKQKEIRRYRPSNHRYQFSLKEELPLYKSDEDEVLIGADPEFDLVKRESSNKVKRSLIILRQSKMIPIEDFIDNIIKEENTGYYDTAQTRNSDTNLDHNDSQLKKSEQE